MKLKEAFDHEITVTVKNIKVGTQRGYYKFNDDMKKYIGKKISVIHTHGDFYQDVSLANHNDNTYHKSWLIFPEEELDLFKRHGLTAKVKDLNKLTKDDVGYGALTLGALMNSGKTIIVDAMSPSTNYEWYVDNDRIAYHKSWLEI